MVAGDKDGAGGAPLVQWRVVVQATGEDVGVFVAESAQEAKELAWSFMDTDEQHRIGNPELPLDEILTAWRCPPEMPFLCV